jgi:polyribonucleotide nucleotidyltransferase
MIGLAKVSISRKYGEELEEVPEIGKKDEEEDEKDVIKSPSMMTLACNTVEALRLREELIQIVHETAVLSEIYSAQLRRTGRSTWKLVQRDPIQFETKLISRDNFNLVDYNDGTRV